MKNTLVPKKPPKAIRLEYYVTTFDIDTSEYIDFTLCKNYTEAKKLYKTTVETQTSKIYISLLMKTNKVYKDNIKTIDTALACMAGKVKA